MNQHQQRQLDAHTRVQDFFSAKADVIGALGSSEGKQEFDTAVTAVRDLGIKQGDADREIAGQKSLTEALTINLRTQHMATIATFARAKLRGVPNYAALTSTPRLEGAKIIRAARTMANAAAPYADAMAKGGFPADTVTQLGDAADALERAIAARANAKVARVGSTNGINAQLQVAKESVAVMNAAINRQFVGQHAFLASWNAARRVVSKPGTPRSTAGTTAPTPAVATTTPVTSAV